ncbi:MAG TPA: hypothetical protein VHP36_09160 [Chitinispirillaceae bacterium]|nr:hypothetical protein [Chitinispirillaceae bacterium]
MTRILKKMTFICCMGIAVSLPAAEGLDLSDAEWITMGQARGVDNCVTSCAFDKSGNLLVAGKFSKAGGAFTNENLARWDGSSWGLLGGGISFAEVLAVDISGNIIASGLIMDSDSTDLYKIGLWDGKSWKSLGKGIKAYRQKGGSNSVKSLAVDKSGNVYVGGMFDSAGTFKASNIAKWDGEKWTPLGSGLNDTVTSIVIDNKGNVYAGGAFTSAGVVAAEHIAKWDGSAWTSLGNGFNDAVNALTIDSDQILYAGGKFTSSGTTVAKRVAKWNGTSWEALGEGTNNEVKSIAVDASGDILAGGAFDSAGTNPATHIARWNGITWSSIGKGLEGCVLTIATDDKGRLFAGGRFDSKTTTTDYLAQWSDSAWHSVGSGNGNNNGCFEHILWDDSGNCYAAGIISAGIGGENIKGLGKWDGKEWKPLGAQLDGSVVKILIKNDGKLIVAGKFIIPGDTTESSVAEWDGTNWSPVGPKLIGLVEDMKFDRKGVLHISGNFKLKDSVSTYALYKLLEDKWTRIGPENYRIGKFVFDLKNKLYAAISLGLVPECNLARWDDTIWTACGGLTDKFIFDVEIDAENKIYIAGRFRRVGDLEVHHIAKWDGTKWNKVGSGTDAEIKDLVIDKNNNIYAGGMFKFAGGFEASKIAWWDGTAWSPVGSKISINGYIKTLDVNDKYGMAVGGDFDMAGGNHSEDIAFVRLPENSSNPVMIKDVSNRRLIYYKESGSIIYSLDFMQHVSFRICSLAGREEYSFSNVASAGVHGIGMAEIRLSKGIHIARLTVGKKSTEMRFVTVR